MVQATQNSESKRRAAALKFKNKKRAGLASGSVVIRFIRLHQGVQKGDATNLGSLSEPRRKQNLYANPKRTAKSKSVTNSDAIRDEKVQTI
jgi:hypothetical protein